MNGYNGEALVSQRLRNHLPPYYTVLDNVIISNQHSSDVSQIDHIIVSPFGVFCIETKSHAGWIVGTSTNKYWTETFYKGRSYRLYNPYRQNYGHIRAIENLCKSYLKAPVVGIVVFPNAKKVVVDGVVCDMSINNCIDLLATYTTQIYDRVQFEHIVSMLQKAQIYDQNRIDKHIVNISKRIAANA